MNRPLPREQAPTLRVPLTNGETWDLSEQSPESFTMVVFYRGLHCPVCKSYLQQLRRLESDYAERGVDVIAVSMDSEDRAKQTVEEWKLQDLKLGYGLDEEAARAWGLYMSEGVKEQEPELFSEPGLFVIRPSGEVYAAVINSMPFGRPDLEGVLKSIDYILKEDYPARGEVRERQMAL